MNKDQILGAIVEMSRRGEISQQEIMQAYGAGTGTTVVEKLKKTFHLSISQVLSTIGGLVICVGIIVLIVQHWDSLSSFLRIFVTLGVAVAAYIVAVLFDRYPNLKITSLVVFVVSMVLMPVGLMVTMHELGGEGDVLIAQIIVSAISFVVALCSFALYRKNIFVAFSVMFGTWLYYVTIIKLLESNGGSFDEVNIYAYMTMIAGLAYVLLGYAFDKSNTERKDLTNWLYAFGLTGILGAGLAIGGVWDVLYIGLVFCVILLSVYIKNRAFLWLGGVFLMFYILKITGEYFTEGFGWPLALVLAGIMLIAVGYFTSYIGKKYITKNETLRS
jgi:hypothetical protein